MHFNFNKSIDEIFGMIAPLIELFAFFLLDKAQKLNRPIVDENDSVSVQKIGRRYNAKEQKKINKMYRFGYFFMCVGCLFWFTSSIIPFIQDCCQF